MSIEKGTWGALVRQPDETISDSADSITTVIRYAGDYAVCKANAPARGAVIAGYTGVVSAVELQRTEGNKGLLTISITASYSPVAAIVTSESHELRWMEIQKPLISHPRYTEYNAGYPGGSTLYTMSETFSTTDPDYAGMTLGEVAKKCEAANAADRNTLLSAASVGAQADFIRDYLGNLSTGSDSYKFFVPILISRTNYTSRPTGTGAGFITSAPSGHPLYGSISSPGSLVWFKDADEVTYSGPSGGYERTQSWIGVDSINANLYKVG